MPQLEFSTFASQIFWLTISYGLIYCFVSRYITSAIFAIKNERREKIDSDLQKAKLFMSEIEDVQNALINLRSDILEKEHDIIIEHKKLFDQNALKEEAKSERKLKKSMQNAQISAKDEEDSIRKKLDELCYVHASFLIKKLTGNNVDEELLKGIVKR
jgi:F-type H+-transporting ATPase subunit b